MRTGTSGLECESAREQHDLFGTKPSQKRSDLLQDFVHDGPGQALLRNLLRVAQNEMPETCWYAATILLRTCSIIWNARLAFSTAIMAE